MGIIQTTKTLRPREKHDFYPTPVELVEVAISRIPQGSVVDILDPGAGSGVWGSVARVQYPYANITGYEIRSTDAHPAYDEWHTGDYLTCGNGGMYDLIIGNPPYKYAEAFIRKSWTHLETGGHLLFLLRLAFLEGQKRAVHFWPDYQPQKVVVLGRRPSFTGNHKTDATAYMLCLWEKGYSGDTTLEWLKWDYDKSK